MEEKEDFAVDYDLRRDNAYIVRFKAAGRSETLLVEQDPKKPIYLIVQSPLGLPDIGKISVRNQAGDKVIEFLPNTLIGDAEREACLPYAGVMRPLDYVSFNNGQLWILRSKPSFDQMKRIIEADIDGDAGLIWLSRPFRAALERCGYHAWINRDINRPGASYVK